MDFNVFSFLGGIIFTAIMWVHDWFLTVRKPMRCLKTLDFKCSSCRCRTCPRFHLKDKVIL